MQTLLAMLGFAFVASFTPGPNNTMVMMSGARFGYRRSLMHIIGIAIGFPVMVVAVGLGLGSLFVYFPVLHEILKYAAFLYMLWLAWKLARSGRQGDVADGVAKPMTFLQAALFQWINPKAWIMVIGALALYVPVGSNTFLGVAALAAVFFIATFPSCSVWCLFGTGISRFLHTERRVTIFNLVMAVLLVGSMVPTLL